MAREGCSRHTLSRHCKFKRSISQLPARQEQQGARPHGLQEGSALETPGIFKNMSPKLVPKMYAEMVPKLPTKMFAKMFPKIATNFF